jgi:hypothetical protein
MKHTRCLFLVLALVLGCCAQRAQGQTAAQNMNFSIICQYITNTYTTNAGTVLTDQHLPTVLINSGNIVRAILVDTFWTNNSTEWASNLSRWQGASIVYEENMTTHNQGIYLRVDNEQINVSQFFINSFSTNGYANMFAQDVTSAFAGMIYPTVLPYGYANVFSQDRTNNYVDNDFPTNTLPLAGANSYGSSPAGLGYDNLAYLTFTSSNTSFALFGYSQGLLVNTVYDQQGDVGKVDKAEIVAAGTFSLNLSTNFLRITNGFTNIINLSGGRTTNYVTTNAVLATNLTGLAHGTVMVTAPYRLEIGPPEGP